MRIFCCLFLFLGLSLACAQAQQPAGSRRNVARFGQMARPAAADTTRPAADSLSVTDTLNGNPDLKTKVVYNDRDSTLMSADQQIVEMFGDAVVTYGEMEIRADYIRLNWNTGEVYAQQRPDSTRSGSIGYVIFKNGSETYNTDEIRYNFKSQRAAIRAIVTKQGEGNVRGRTVKKDSANNFYLRGALYTTCDLTHPHYGITSAKIKLAQGRGDYKQVISGPFNLQIAGVPLPIGLPFGFFPFSEKRQSGIIVGNYGEEPQSRGFYLRDFGYYWAAGEHLGLRFTGQLYSRGSWGVGTQGSYIKRYRYTGSFTLQYNYNRSGDEIGPNRNISRDFSIQWSHAPQVLGRPYSFSASVNITTSNYLRINEQNIYGYGSNLGRYQQNVFGSSVQYSRNFGDLVQTSMNLRVNQNVATRTVTAGAGLSANLVQFQPFLRKNALTQRWYESFRFGLTFNASADITNDLSAFIRNNTTYTDITFSNLVVPANDSANSISRTVVPFTAENIPYILRNAQVRNTFQVPIGLPNFKIARNINLTPSISLQGDLFTKRLKYTYLPPQGLTAADTIGRVRIDTTSGLFPAYNFSTALSLNTQLYGTFYFRKLGRLSALRHMMSPSLSLGYTPDFSRPGFGFYDYVQINEGNDRRMLPRLIGYSGSVGQAASANFSITNRLEAKLRAKSDTAKEEFQKISILDNLGLSTSYNFLADSFALSPIAINANTVILKKYNINFSSTLDPYVWEKDRFLQSGRRFDRLLLAEGRGLGRLQSMSIGFSTSFQGGSKDKNRPDRRSDPNATGYTGTQMQFIQANPQLYIDWAVPWTLNISYNYSYTRIGLQRPLQYQTLSLNGDVSLTEKWKMTFTTGYDFVLKAPSLTNIGLTRDLHCWEASFNWTPIGQNLRAGNYNFELRVKSSLLKDLKLSRRRSFYDMGGGF